MPTMASMSLCLVVLKGITSEEIHRGLDPSVLNVRPCLQGEENSGRMRRTKTKIRELKIVKIDNDLWVVMIKGGRPWVWNLVEYGWGPPLILDAQGRSTEELKPKHKWDKADNEGSMTILRSLPEGFRPKVTTIEESKDIDSMRVYKLLAPSRHMIA
ncbi:hypothetical protein CK203_065900 [Vitis vinifera]|uniref:Uncharacterized protein n=1 Tax=Vitis vinifera TaxID=29760 RepID=A0A438G3Y6_VITVI|nr:hypothetical protein CK203_065900 [Vitis vinifera]